MSLRTRIALIASVAVAVAVVAMATVVYLVTQGRLIDEIDESLTDRANLARAAGELAESFGNNNRFRGGGPFRDPRGFDVLYVQLVAPDGATLVPEGQELTLPAPPQIDGVGPTVMTEATVDGVHLRVANVALGETGGVLQIARSLAEVDATLASLSLTLLLIGAVGIGGAALLGLFIARSSLRPIGDLTEAAERVAATKELAHRIDVDRADELGRLAGAFNEMLAALEGSKEQQRRLVRDAGHELRTPLTALRTNIELLAKAEKMEPEQRSEIYDDLNAELSELTDLLNEVVEVAAEAEVTEPVTQVDLGDLVEGVVARFRRRALQPIGLIVDAPAVVAAQANRVERAVANLIDNAVKWSGPNEEIEVTVTGGRITVSDLGPGIDEADRPHVFDRFYRAPAARTTAGSGLGLSIVKQVAEAHGGTAFVADHPGGGASVGLELPVG